jgi:hypothetical protein
MAESSFISVAYLRGWRRHSRSLSQLPSSKQGEGP